MFFAEINKKSTEDTRTDSEKDNALSVVWLSKDEVLKKMAEQLKKLEKGEVEFYNTAFNIFRDFYFFKEYLSSKKA